MNPRYTRVQVCATQKKLGREKGGGKLNHCYRFGCQMDLDSLIRVFNLSSQFLICEYELLENAEFLHLSLMTTLLECYQRGLYYQRRLFICLL